MNAVDRVKETSTTTGSGVLTLAGAATGFITFNTAFSTNKPFYYVIDGGSEWEVGLGYLSGSTTLVRQAILASSNSGSVVTLSAGTKTVFHDAPADFLDVVPTLGESLAMAAGQAMF